MIFFAAKYFGSGVIIATAFIHVSTCDILAREAEELISTNSSLHQPMKHWEMDVSQA